MMETYLDLMRTIEVYQARRIHELGAFDLKLDLLLCSETAEKYLHMSQIEEEKRAYKALFEAKPKLIIDRRDYELEEQVK